LNRVWPSHDGHPAHAGQILLPPPAIRTYVLIHRTTCFTNTGLK